MNVSFTLALDPWATCIIIVAIAIIVPLTKHWLKA